MIQSLQQLFGLLGVLGYEEPICMLIAYGLAAWFFIGIGVVIGRVSKHEPAR